MKVQKPKNWKNSYLFYIEYKHIALLFKYDESHIDLEKRRPRSRQFSKQDFVYGTRNTNEICEKIA